MLDLDADSDYFQHPKAYFSQNLLKIRPSSMLAEKTMRRPSSCYERVVADF